MWLQGAGRTSLADEVHLIWDQRKTKESVWFPHGVGVLLVMNLSPLCLLPILKEVQGTEYQHSFPTFSGPSPSLPRGLVTDVQDTLLLTLIVPFPCIKRLCSIHGGKYGPSPISPTPRWPQLPEISHQLPPNLICSPGSPHSSLQSEWTPHLLPSIHLPLSLAHCPRPSSYFRSLWWLQWSSRLFCLFRIFCCFLPI